MALFRFTSIVLPVVIVAFLQWLLPTIPFHLLYFGCGMIVISYALTWIAGSASRGIALRPVVAGKMGTPMPDPSRAIANAKAWYVESKPTGQGLPNSCSFIEFDERGDYLDFHQHVHAYEKVTALAKSNEHLIVVFFVHGWRNNTNSDNVVSFNEFLNQLGDFSDSNGIKHRVHGIYLSWRGGCLKHALTLDQRYNEVTQRYNGDPIVDIKQAARFPRLNGLLESFSYFDRKGVPEHLSSGTSLSRTLFTCAHTTKRHLPTADVFLIGHSFGGLMLERTFQNACIGELTMAWPWGDPTRVGEAKANPLPFDTVLLVNSAAPSIYAKQFQSYCAAHREAMKRDNVPDSDLPVFLSLTSSADKATGKLHPLANRFCFLIPTLRRRFKGNEFILADQPGSASVKIQQSYYYRHTPGHNPLLVNRFIEPVKETNDKESEPQEGRGRYLHRNLRHAGAAHTFFTTPRPGGTASQWSINFPPQTSTFDNFSRYPKWSPKFRPVVWESDIHGNYIRKETAYWILRCTKEIIKDHNDIWSQQAMDTYAALYAISRRRRKAPEAS